MFKPIEIFYKKHVSKGESKKDLYKKWINLKEKKIKKFVKKAEKKYDLAYQEDTDLSLFITYLNKKESEILFKSYGLPEKIPFNRKVFLLKKLNKEYLDTSLLDEEAKKEIDNKWNQLSAAEKQELTVEFEKANQEYSISYFDFARNLPATRVEDYKEYIRNNWKKTKQEKHDQVEVKNLQRKFIPFEIFLEKYKIENPSLNLKDSRLQSRQKYKNMSVKKKLKVIKEAADNYDKELSEPSSKIMSSSLKKPFAQYLTKEEQKILMESYGMPQIIPNLSAYYFQNNYSKFKNEPDGMKHVFEMFRKMPENEKDEWIEKHRKAIDEFSILHKKFLEKLPLNRLDDYNFMKAKPKDENSKSQNKKIKVEAKSEDEKEISINDPKIKAKSVENKHDKSTEKEISDNESVSHQNYSNNNEEIGSVYESAGESDTSRSSSIRINESKIIDDFVKKCARRPENAFSIFLQEEIKWNVKSKMNEEDSKAFLLRVVEKWSNLSESEKAKFEKKLNETKKELKKNIKEFLMNELDNDEMKPEDLYKKIDQTALNKNRKITFRFGNGESKEAYIYDFMSLIHSSIEIIDPYPLVKMEKLNGFDHNGEESITGLKRKLEKESSIKNVKNKKKN